MALSDITAAAVEAAIAEFDMLGRSPFLSKYEFGPARGYFLLRGDEKYDSKAIAGAAHGFLANKAGPLRSADFSGGDKSVARKLRELGFQVLTPADSVTSTVPFDVGRTYHRQRDIHQVFGGQERGGIASPGLALFVFLFTGESGSEFGYEDGWKTDGSFSYTGEGQLGDMQFLRGNRAIRDHREDGKDLLLFEAMSQKGYYRFLGAFACMNWRFVEAKDLNDQDRKAIVFDLALVEDTPHEDAHDHDPETGTIEQLRKAAYGAAKDGPTERSTGGSAASFFLRSAAVRAYVLRRAEGVCECCGMPSPFVRKNGTPYLEPHHTHRLADGGPDHPAWVGAVCPTCHREIHHGANGYTLNERLKVLLSEKEASLGQ